jgi:protein TonB
MGMFEQSLLIDPPGAKKTGALALSITMQTAAVAVMIALPLIYSDRLPLAPRFISIAFPPPAPPPPPMEHVQATSSTTRGSALTPKPFVAPRRIVALSEIPQISALEAPPEFAPSHTAGVPGGIGGSSLAAEILHEIIIPPKPPVVVEMLKPPSKPVMIGGDVQEAKLIRKVIPPYPALARQARVSGTVRLIGVIAKDGTIQQLQLVSGHPLLAPAALEAVRQWLYRPTILNGQAVEVIAPIDVIFKLGQ